MMTRAIVVSYRNGCCAILYCYHYSCKASLRFQLTFGPFSSTIVVQARKDDILPYDIRAASLYYSSTSSALVGK